MDDSTGAAPGRGEKTKNKKNLALVAPEVDGRLHGSGAGGEVKAQHICALLQWHQP